ncbi:uncharacterized protein LOC124928107 [Impatiens glandulifera]|uniref:uncharacterized protein LOC124928107 n=1 Tax=Impatiens glandulifera TaxID=253017 RepID=UPI001FB0B859|nr:uncharacterized protein LOC124928107 [Impatiens glandulifera]
MRMAKSIHMSHLFLLPSRTRPLTSSRQTLSSLLCQRQVFPCNSFSTKLTSGFKFFSTHETRYPLQYDMIISRPAQATLPAQRRRRPTRAIAQSESPDSPDSEPEAELGFDDWVDRKLSADKKLSAETSEAEGNQLAVGDAGMDKSKRKYYNKRRKRMYGSDSDEDGNGRDDDEMVELVPEVVEFNTLHKREEELYFYDTFAYPWDKDKHYRMVYQLEKKYFPDQGFDKAFLQPGESNENPKKSVSRRGGEVDKVKKLADAGEEKKLVFFEDDKKGAGTGAVKDLKKDISERKVEEFFQRLKKVDTHVAIEEPFVSSRSAGLPSKWDSPNGNVLLINKPKGWTSFTVCGKLRRIVKVKKVGHAGTLDPMATGLLIVCVGKSTKLVDRYQGMIKGYSGVFRLGEATSTWDADSPVIQRESWEHIKDDDIKKSAVSFVGEIWQVPPMFSAIKVGGERMYEKARRGESIELSPRRISIYQFDIERSLDDRQNLIFRVTCSKGTYIRSLCADLGKALGSCAHLTALRRDSIGQYSADDAWDFKELEETINKNYI